MGRLVRQVAHVGIFARDLPATERFWTEVLEIPVAFRFMRDSRCIGLSLDAGATTAIEIFDKAETRYSEADQINHVALEVHDIDDAIATVRSRGVEVTDKKRAVDGSWQAWLHDPGGVKIELFQLTPQSAQFVGGDREADW